MFFSLVYVFWSVGNAKATDWELLNLALCTVNLAEAAGDCLKRELMAEIYVLVAVTLRPLLPTKLYFISVNSSEFHFIFLKSYFLLYFMESWIHVVRKYIVNVEMGISLNETFIFDCFWKLLTIWTLINQNDYHHTSNGNINIICISINRMQNWQSNFHLQN